MAGRACSKTTFHACHRRVVLDVRLDYEFCIWTVLDCRILLTYYSTNARTIRNVQSFIIIPLIIDINKKSSTSWKNHRASRIVEFRSNIFPSLRYIAYNVMINCYLVLRVGWQKVSLNFHWRRFIGLLNAAARGDPSFPDIITHFRLLFKTTSFTSDERAAKSFCSAKYFIESITSLTSIDN